MVGAKPYTSNVEVTAMVAKQRQTAACGPTPAAPRRRYWRFAELDETPVAKRRKLAMWKCSVRSVLLV